MTGKATDGKSTVCELMHRYGERDIDGILNILTDDVIWIGTAFHEHKFGKAEVRALLIDDLSTDPSSYDIRITECREAKMTNRTSAFFLLTQTTRRGNPEFVLESRNTITCYDDGEGYRVCSWHCSMATELQQRNEYFPISFAEDILQKATMDPLTSILNRSSFEGRVRKYLVNPDAPFAFILIDLDDFKHVNDRYGHQSGDAVLIWMADCLNQIFDGIGIIARLGGDEFLAFVPGLSDNRRLSRLIDSFAESLQQPMILGRESYTPSASTGIYIHRHPKKPITYEECFKAADDAMYRNKKDKKTEI